MTEDTPPEPAPADSGTASSRWMANPGLVFGSGVAVLLEAYRAIVKGDAAFTRWPRTCRARSSIQGNRIRSRVYRAMLRRETNKPDSNELE